MGEEGGVRHDNPPAGWYEDPEAPGHTRYWDGTRWGQRESEAADEIFLDISVVGIGLALLGALAMIIGVFLPRTESSAFGGVQQNTLIQSGDGWLFLGLAAGIAGAVYRSWKNGTRTWAVIVLAVIAMGVAYYQGTNKEKLTLYPVDPQSGNADTSKPGEKASPGVGIYVVGAGGALALFGGWSMRRDSTPRLADLSDEPSATEPVRPTKTCPECAETVLAAARVCKHCGYRFELTEAQELAALRESVEREQGKS